MSDDDRYNRNDDYYDEDYDDDFDDDDEDETGSVIGRPGSPFTTGGSNVNRKPFDLEGKSDSSPSYMRSSSSSRSGSGSDLPGKRPTGVSNYGSGSSNTPQRSSNPSPFSGGGSSSGTSRTSSSSGFGSQSSSSSTPSSYSGGGSSSGASRTVSNTFGGQSSSSSTPSSYSGGSSSGGTSRTGSSSNYGSQSSSPYSSGSSSSSTRSSGVNDTSKPKKDDSESKIGGLLGKLPFVKKSADDQKSNQPGRSSTSTDAPSGGIGSRLSGLTSSISSKIPKRGGDDATTGKSSGGTGSNTGSGASRFNNPGSNFNRGKDDPNKASSTKKDDAGGGGIKDRFGGLKNRFSRGKSDDASATATGGRTDNRSSTYGGGSSTTSPSRGSGAGFSAAGNSRSSDFSKSSGNKKDNKKEDSSGGGFFSRFRRGNKDEKKSTSSRSKKEKVPRVASEGLDLDTKLDYLGVGLVFGAIVILLTSLSNEQAAIKGIHTALGQLLGWGSFAIPIAMILAGVWLMKRRFGDQAPTIDPLKLLGFFLAYICLLVTFQYIDSFTYVGVSSYEILELRLQFAWEVHQSGGGWVGAQLYYWLVINLTEIGGIVVLSSIWLLAVMLITSMSPVDMVAWVVAWYRGIRVSVQHRAATKRAKRLEAQLQAESQAAQIQISKPEPQQIAAGMTFAGALPEGTNTIEDRDILFRKGGQPLQSQASVPYSVPHTASVSSSASSGLFGRGSKDKSDDQSSGGGLFSFMRRGEKEVTIPQNPANVPEPTILKPTTGEEGFKPTTTAGTVATGAAASHILKPDDESRNQPAQTGTVSTSASRQDRLDEIRKGQLNPPASGDGFSGFGRPEDRIIHPSEQVYTPPAPKAPPSVASMAASSNNGGHQNDLLFGGSSQRQDSPTAPAKPSPSIDAPISRTSRKVINWKTPDYRTLLASGSEQDFDRKRLIQQAKVIEDTLLDFGAPGKVVEVNTGPVITQFGVEPDYITSRSGKQNRVKVNAIKQLDKDLQLALNAKSIRIEAPVPGKGYVGIEVPNPNPATVSLRDVMDTDEFRSIRAKSPLAIALGQSVDGAPVAADLSVMPHILIAGTTGSGKSVLVNAIINCLLVNNTPEEVKFVMVDPKRVELTGYNGIPHLVAPVVVDLERTSGVLKWCTREMDERYRKFSDAGARNIEDYNRNRPAATVEKMPYIVVIIDELADLMMMAPEETERAITRIAALARATGIHLVIATQRPSVDVVTGLIKANFPARAAFAVAGGVDSRVILDQPGAETLLGRGDMLYLSGNSPAAVRLQGVFLSDLEINNITRYWKTQAAQTTDANPLKTMTSDGDLATTFVDDVGNFTSTSRPAAQPSFSSSPAAAPPSFSSPSPTTPASSPGHANVPNPSPQSGNFWDQYREAPEEEVEEDSQSDELYEKAVELVRRQKRASISMLQRKFRIGYTRAARLMDIMEENGIVGPPKHGSSKPRDVLPET
ncbi:hypothetical protein MASR2M15_00450 [Anaerolineales bacterium]